MDGDAKGADGLVVGAGGVLRRRTTEEWDRIVQESFGSDLTVRELARRHGVSASQLSRRRSRARREALPSAGLAPAYVPVSVQESGGRAEVTIDGRGVTVRLAGEIDAAGIAAIAVALAGSR